MASKRAHLNAKRSLRRRNLAERLELARRDADTVLSEEEAPAPWQTGTAKAGGSSSARAPEAKAQPKVQPRAKKEIKNETKSEVKDEPQSEDESLPGALARGKPSRAAHLAPRGAQAIKSLRRGHFMGQMQINVEQRRAIRQGFNNMRVPNLIEQRARLLR